VLTFGSSITKTGSTPHLIKELTQSNTSLRQMETSCSSLEILSSNSVTPRSTKYKTPAQTGQSKAVIRKPVVGEIVGPKSLRTLKHEKLEGRKSVITGVHTEEMSIANQKFIPRWLPGGNKNSFAVPNTPSKKVLVTKYVKRESACNPHLASMSNNMSEFCRNGNMDGMNKEEIGEKISEKKAN